MSKRNEIIDDLDVMSFEAFQIGQKFPQFGDTVQKFHLGDKVRFNKYVETETVEFLDTKLVGYVEKETDTAFGFVTGERFLQMKILKSCWQSLPYQEFWAYLVSYDLRRNPIVVLAEHLEKVEE